MALSQKQIKSLAQKIAKNTKDTEFCNHLVIANILTLLTEQKPCYSQFEYLGKGTSALVLKAKVNDSEQVALKIEQFDKSNQKVIEAIQREYEIVKSLQNNEYIIKQNNSFILAEEEEEQGSESVDASRQVQEGKSEGFESANTVNRYFVTETELCQGNLAEYLDFLRKNEIVMEERIKIIMVIQMLDAINHLHQQDIAHRDIKPQNFLFQEKEGFLILKLCDFGFASPFDIKNSKSYLSGKGTAGYTAPEVEKGQSRKESDLYSLGIIILEIDNSPFFNYSEVTTAEIGVLQLGQGIFSNHNLNTSSVLFQIASTSLKPNFKERTSAKQILLDLLKEQQHILKNIPIYSIILDNQLSLLSLSIPQSKNKKDKQIQELKSISVSLPSSEVTTKKKIEALLDSYSNQDNQNSLTQTQAEGVLRALFKKGDYDNFEILGAGSAGLIVGGVNLKYQRQSALKICLCENKAEIFRQIDILNKCQMPRIVKFYGYQFILDDNNNEYVVFEMERCRSTLTQYLDEQCLNNKPYSAELKMELAIQMIDSINYLHEHEILHRDIKLDNFLIKEGETGEIMVKLTDFDQAARLEENNSWKDNDEKHEDELLPPYNCLIILDKQGTFPYYAPERFNIFFPTTKKTDTYSLGLCLLVLDNYLSFSENQLILKHSLLINPYSEPFLEQKQIIIDRNSQIYNIARKLLVYLPNNRIHLSKILAISNSFRLAYSRQIEYPFNQKKIESIYYFKMSSRKQKVEFQLIIDQISIMKNLSSLSLDLQSNSIGELGVNYVSKALSKFTNLSSLSLNLRKNQITDSGTNYLSMALSKLTIISSLSLDLSWNSIGKSGANYLSKALSKLTNLFSLSLNLRRNEIKDFDAIYVSTALSKLTNISSLSLNLSWNSIGKSGANYLSPALSELTNLSSLSLNLFNNSIGEPGANYVSTALLKLTNLSSLSLNHKGYSIGDSGAKYVSTALSKLANLSSLSLNLDDNSIGVSGANYLSTSLSELTNLSSLSLNLDTNSIRDSGANYLSTALSKLTNLSSLSLNLYFNSIGDLGANNLSTALSKLTNLSSLSLNLYFNSIGALGANNLLTALSKLTNLSSLGFNIGGNKIENSGANYLQTALSKLTNLSSLGFNIGGNKIENSGANYLQTALSKLTNLSSLGLDFRLNSIGDSGANYLSKGISKLTNLSSLILNLISNSIGDSGANYLSTALSKLTNLSSLSLSLDSNLIGELGANYLSTGISKLTILSSLSLNLNYNSIIGESGANYLSTALSKLTNLSSLSLNLEYNSIGDSGANYLSPAFSKLTNLFSLSLNLDANLIGDSGANYLSTALSKLTNLTSLSLSLDANSIGDSGANYLSTALSKLTNLTGLSLVFGRNQIQKSGAKDISKALEQLNMKSKSQNYYTLN